MKYVKSNFGSSYSDDPLYDLRVDYMQPSLYPSETQDHLERELREEIENISMDNGNFYYEGDQSDDAIIDEKQNSSYKSENASKVTIADAMAKAQTASNPTPKTNKPLLVGAAATIAALMYFNKG
jgi:hypothetical protein